MPRDLIVINLIVIVGVTNELVISSISSLTNAASDRRVLEAPNRAFARDAVQSVREQDGGSGSDDNIDRDIARVSSLSVVRMKLSARLRSVTGERLVDARLRES